MNGEKLDRDEAFLQRERLDMEREEEAHLKMEKEAGRLDKEAYMDRIKALYHRREVA